MGGNPVVLSDRDGFELDLTVPSLKSPLPEWQSLFEGARLRAERMLARPVTHAVVVAREDAAECAQGGAAEARLTLLRIVGPDTIHGEGRALTAAILAEELAPRNAAPE